MRRGLPAVVAMQYEISDRAAIEFVQTFYKAVADGLPVDTAVAEARVAMSLALPETLEWGTPVLYMKAQDGRVFTVQDVPPHDPLAEKMTGVPSDTRVAEPEHSVAAEVQKVIQAEPTPSTPPIDEPLPNRLKRVVSGPAAWRFVLLWMLATTVGFGVGFTVGGSVGSALGFVVGGAVVGAVVGIGQWLVPRQRLLQAKWWILATTISFGIGFAAYTAVSGAVSDAVSGALVGAIVGIGQWLVLRKHLSQTEWWIFATTVSFAVGFAMYDAVSDTVSDAAGGAVIGAIYGAVTGILLFWLLQHPIQGTGSRGEF